MRVTNYPDHEQALGQKIRAMRKELRWSQPELAQRMRSYGYEWSQATVTRLEGATRPIRVNEAAHLAELFGTSLAGLLNADGPTPTAGVRETERAIRERIAAEILGR